MGFGNARTPDPKTGRCPHSVSGSDHGRCADRLVGRRAFAIWIMSLFGAHELALISVSVALPYLALYWVGTNRRRIGVIAVVSCGDDT